MKLNRLWLLLVLLLSTASDSLAQGSQNVWHFGKNLGLDFNTEPPTVLTQGLDTALEGTASIADCTGKLLFYSNGVTVFNRLHQPMLNGTGLKSDLSSTQSCLIVPDPGNEHRYYLFITDQSGYARFDQTRPRHEGMHLNVIDMRGDNGRGAVVERDIPLLTQCAEKLTGIWLKASNTYWVIAHSLYGNEFNAWRVTATGVYGPTKSYAGFSNLHELHATGSLVASPNGTLLVSLLSNLDIGELFKFDTTTGDVSLICAVPKVESGYGAAFSPDNSKLYVGGFGELYQFDLTVMDLATMAATKHQVSNQAIGAIQLGPDGRMYVRTRFDHTVHRIGIIQEPNLSGDACAFDPAGIVADPWALMQSFGMPNVILGLYDEVCAAPIAIEITPQEVCEDKLVEFSDSSRRVTSWKWSFEGGTPATSDQSKVQVSYAEPGSYRVQLIVANEVGADTVESRIIVLSCPLPDVALRDTIICVGQCVSFADTSRYSSTWQWSFEGGEPSVQTSRKTLPVCFRLPGRYKVTLIASNVYGADTAESYVTVADCDDPVSSFLHDTLVCIGEAVSYMNTSLNGTSWSWRFGSGTPSSSDKQHPDPVVYNRAGVFQTRLIVGNGAESDTSYSNITVWDCAAPITDLQDHTICEGDSILFGDASTNYPSRWQWTFDAGSPASSAARDPGYVRFDEPGVHSIQLIVSNEYGSDTANATVTVLSAKPIVRPATLDILAPLNTCVTFDTAIWIYTGCKEVMYELDASGVDYIDVPLKQMLIPANDSLRIPVQIRPVLPALVNSAILIDLNLESFKIPVSFHSIQSGGLEVFPKQIDFGETSICATPDSTLTLTNNGCDTIVITNASVNQHFSIGGEFPIRLEPGQSVELPVTALFDTTDQLRSHYGIVLFESAFPGPVWNAELRRTLVYPTRLRIEATDEASGLAGDNVKFRIILEGDVPSRMTALHFDFLHNNDLLSFESLDGAGLAITRTAGEADQRQSFTLSPVHAGVLGEVTFKAYLAEAEQTTLSFDNITFEAEGVGFAPECIAVISDSGSRFNYVYECADEVIRSSLRRETLIKSLTPNPATNEIRLELANGAGEAEVVIVDMLGAEVLRREAGERIDVSHLVSGTYYLRVSAGGAVQSRRVIIER